MNVSIQQTVTPDPAIARRQSHMPALTGIRFFAILHIFFFHLWAVYDMDKEPGFENFFRDMAELPATFLTYLSNGWMSTSFFFLLSGFLLAYLYWGADGKLTISRKTFWVSRATRIYPIHIFLLLFTFLGAGYHLDNGVDLFTVIGSAITSLLLVQAWYPSFVPIWSWPTWTISALLFLYAVMPFLMPVLAKLSRRRMVMLLAALPVLSLIPTMIYAWVFPTGSEPELFWQIFIGSTPIFWLAHFVAGMLLTRVFSLSKHQASVNDETPRWFAWGDLALIAVIAIACIPNIQEPFKYFLRHGLLMPLYMLIILDLARGRGVAARLLSWRFMEFLGETGFSIFIWQTFVLMMCWGMVMMNPESVDHQFLGATIGIILLAIISTYLIEKPLAVRLRKKFLTQKAE